MFDGREKRPTCFEPTEAESLISLGRRKDILLVGGKEGVWKEGGKEGRNGEEG